MIIPNEKILTYLLHRVGERRLDTSPFMYEEKALEGNVQRSDFLQTYGKKIIKAYVGFVDLAEFSTQVKGLSPQQIADYLFPFLEGVIKILRNRLALVDKMIGDEIMFVLPDFEEIGMPPSILLLGQILGGFYEFAYNVDLKYKYRIGLSYGEMLVSNLKGEGYSEWTMVGEPVHVAKRLQGIPALQHPNPILGAIGLCAQKETDDIVTDHLQQILNIVAGPSSRFNCSIQNPADLKGVGRVIWALLKPKRQNHESSLIELAKALNKRK